MYKAYWAKHDIKVGKILTTFFNQMMATVQGTMPSTNGSSLLSKNSPHNIRRQPNLVKCLETWCRSLQPPSYSAPGHPFCPLSMITIPRAITTLKTNTRSQTLRQAQQTRPS
jgi:hypothetical protein